MSTPALGNVSKWATRKKRAKCTCRYNDRKPKNCHHNPKPFAIRFARVGWINSLGVAWPLLHDCLFARLDNHASKIHEPEK